jgi:hypothetical protein
MAYICHMKAQSIKNNDREDRLAITKSATTSNWPLLPGLLLSDLGLLSIAFAGWDALSARAHTLFYSSGAILCLVGLVFIWIGTTGIAAVVQKHARPDFLSFHCSRFFNSDDLIARVYPPARLFTRI